MAAALDMKSLAWVGPDTQSDIEVDFMNFVERHTVMDADVWTSLDTEANLFAARLEMSNGTFNDCDAARCDKLPITRFFPTVAAKNRMQGYIDRASNKAGTASGDVACDPSQNPETRGRASPWLPTLTRGTKPIWLSPAVGDRGYVYTMRELAFSQGWPSIPTSGNHAARSTLAFDLHKLPTCQQRSLLGNGMHLCSLASFFIYVMAHVVRRDVIKEFLPDLRLLKIQPGTDWGIWASPNGRGLKRIFGQSGF